MFWDTLQAVDIPVTLSVTTFVFLTLAGLTIRLAPAERKGVLGVAALFAFSVLGIVAAGVLRALGYTAAAAYTVGFANLLGGVAMIWIVALFLFRACLPRIRLHPPRILQDVLFTIGVIVWVFINLSRQGVDLSSILTTSAVLTAVIGFSLQDTLGNIFAGLALQLDRSINVGDWLRIENVYGIVIEIRWRQTTIETNEWETVIIPNSILVKNRVMLLGKRTDKPVLERRWVTFHVDTQYDPGDVIDAVVASLHSATIPLVSRDPLPICVLRDLNQNPAQFAVSYWLTNIRDANPGDSEVRLHVYKSLKRAGIPIAIPTHGVFMTEDTQKFRARKTEQEVEARMEALRKIDFLDCVADEELRGLAEHLKPAPFAAGDLMTKQGATAHWLYYIVKGTAEVIVENEQGEHAKVADLEPGNMFGEMGLMTGEPRRASVIATSNCETFRLDKESFQHVIKAHPEIAEYVSVVLADRKAKLAKIRGTLKTAEAIDEDRHSILEKIRSFFSL